MSTESASAPPPPATATPAGAPTTGGSAAVSPPTAVPPAPAGDGPSIWANREFTGIFAAFTLSQLGDQLARVALTILLWQTTDSAAWAAAGYAVTLLPALASAFGLASIADRRPRRQVMIVCDVACAALVAAMVIPGLPPLVLLGLILLSSMLASLFAAARGALGPVLFQEDHQLYSAATAVNNITARITVFAGFAAGGLLVALLGPRTALAVDAVTFAASAVLVRLTVRARPAAGTGEREPFTTGLRVVLGDRTLRTLACYGWLASFYVAPLGVAAPYAARHGGGSIWIGFLMAAPAGGAILGTTLLATRVPVEQRSRWLVPGSVLASAPLMLTAADPGLVVVVVLWAVAGVATGYNLIAQVGFMTATPDRHRGAAFGVVGAGMATGQGAALLAVAAFAGPLGPGGAVAAFGVAGTLAALALARAGTSWVASSAATPGGDPTTGPIDARTPALPAR